MMNLLIVKCEESLICCAKKNTDADIESNTDGTDEHGNVLLAKHQSEKSVLSVFNWIVSCLVNAFSNNQIVL